MSAGKCYKHQAGIVNQATGWTNSANVKIRDTSYAYYISTKIGTIRVSGFGLQIPAGATILGIEVSVKAADSYQNTYANIKVTNDGTSTWSDTKRIPPSGNFTSTPTEYTVGADDDLWGLDWDVDKLSNSNFQVQLDIAGASTGTPAIYYIIVTVYFTHSGGSDFYTVHAATLAGTNVTNVDRGRHWAGDNNYADVSYAATLKGIVFSDFDAHNGLPGGATVSGIEILAYLYDNYGDSFTQSNISFDDGGSWDTDERIPSSGNIAADSSTLYITGGSADKWGEVAISSEDLDDSHLQARIYESHANDLWSIDGLYLKIYYSTGGVGPTGVKTINDLAIASVKTINDLAIANVKTINDAS